MEEIKPQVAALIRLHQMDIIGKDITSKDLCDYIKSLSDLAMKGGKTFGILTEQTQFIEEILSLIVSHENEDVVGATIRLLGDLTDPEAYEGEERESSLKLVNKLLDLDFPSELCSIMNKQPELRPECLLVFENLCEIYPTAVPTHLVEKTPIILQLLEMIDQNSDLPVGDCLTASELLSTILHVSELGRQTISTNSELFNQLLETIAIWKSKGPEFAEDVERCESVHSCVRRCLLDDTEAKNMFRKLDGIELALRLRGSGQILGMKLIAIATTGNIENCKRFVDAGGLKMIFPLIVLDPKKQEGSKKLKTTQDEGINPVLSILSNLCLNLSNEDLEWARVLNKFLEDGKIQAIVNLYEKYVETVNEEIDRVENKDEDEDSSVDSEEEYLELLASGLEEVQRICIILGRLLSIELSSQKVREAFEDVEEIRQALVDYVDHVIVLNKSAVDETETTKVRQTIINLALFPK